MASLFTSAPTVTASSTKKPAGSLFAPAPAPATGGAGLAANTADFLGEGVNALPNTANVPAPVRTAPVTGTGPLSSGKASGFQGPRTVSGGASYDPAAQIRAFENGNIGGAGGAANMNPPTVAPATAAPGAPAAGSPLDLYMETALKGMANPQIAASNALGSSVRQQGVNANTQQAQTAAGFQQQGQGFTATAPTVAAKPTGFIDMRTGQPQMTAGFNVGAQVPTTGGTRAPAALSTSQLGATPTIGQIAGVAGQLGGAPRVGQVGNIQTGAAPGGITGQLGQQGAGNADQSGMLSRLNGFLDAGNGPSMAEAQLQQAQANNMGDLIGAARSGRGGAGAQAQALRGAMSEGSAIMSDTAGQLATLRAQEEDMLKNRQLNAIGMGGEMSTAQRGQDLSFRGQNLQGLQGDQSTALGARGQDLQASMANQGTQTALEQLRAQTALGARGQNLSALQGDQSTTLGRESLGAQTALAGRGQDLSLLQGNQSTALGARGQDVSRELGLANVNLGMRGQDAGVLQSDADRNLGAQRLGLDAGLGYGALANDATGQGLNYLSQANQQGIMAQGLSNDMSQNLMNNYAGMNNAQVAANAGISAANINADTAPTFGESLAIAGLQAIPAVAGAAAMSDIRAKTDIKPLDAIAEHLRGAPGYRYRYKPGVGEDPDVEHAGPMAQDLERGPFGKELVKKGADGYRRVDTSRLSLVNHAALSGMRSELDKIKAQLET